MTSHGGTIVSGCPTVLICGQPAARVGDNTVCPMVTPGNPPIPHVGGPILTGSATVIICSQPAARVGDITQCVGAQATIATGCATVIIGP
ncbi:PAAR domain-containing protein [candidate division KSB1 bacterium]|nr:PAAR domain-containing protein [candidate division KSB1 bacterium]